MQFGAYSGTIRYIRRYVSADSINMFSTRMLLLIVASVCVANAHGFFLKNLSDEQGSEEYAQDLLDLEEKEQREELDIRLEDYERERRPDKPIAASDESDAKSGNVIANKLNLLSNILEFKAAQLAAVREANLAFLRLILAPFYAKAAFLKNFMQDSRLVVLPQSPLLDFAFGGVYPRLAELAKKQNDMLNVLEFLISLRSSAELERNKYNEPAKEALLKEESDAFLNKMMNKLLNDDDIPSKSDDQLAAIDEASKDELSN